MGTNIGTLTAHIGLNTAPLQAGAMQAQGTIAGLKKNMMGLNTAMGKLAGAAAALGASIGGLLIFKAITTTGIEFQHTMETTGGVMRATAEEFEKVVAAARKMGEETEFTASQAGRAMYYLASAGFSASESIQALPGVLDLATVSSLDLARSADIAVNALRGMGLGTEELGRVNDVLVGTFTRTNTMLDLMAESLTYSAPIAKAFGYSIEELSGMIGILANAGIRGSMAGTQLAMAIQQANKAAVKLGYDSADLIDVLARMKEEGRNATDVLDLFGMRAGRAALVLWDATDATRELQKTLTGVTGESAKLATRMRSTVKSSFAELKSVIESLGISAWENYKDALKKMVKDTTAWLRENKDDIIASLTAMSDTFLALIKTIGMVISSIVELGQTVRDSLIGVIEQSTKEITDQEKEMDAWRAAFEPPPLQPWQVLIGEMDLLWKTVTNVVLAGLKILAVAIVSTLKLVGGMIENLVGIFKDFFDAIMAFVSGDFDKAGEKFKSVVDRLFVRQLRNLWDVAGDTQSALGKIGEDFAKKSTAGMTAESVYADQIKAAQAAWKEKYFVGPPEVVIPIEWGRTIAGDMRDAIFSGTAAIEMPMPKPKLLGPNIGALAGHYKRATPGTVGEDDPDAIAEQKRIFRLRLDLHRELLKDSERSTAELDGIWKSYYVLRTKEIQDYAKDLKKAGEVPATIAKAVELRTKELNAEAEIMFTERQNRGLDEQVKIYRDLSMSSTTAAEDSKAAWERYSDARLDQIGRETEEMDRQGVVANAVAESMHMKIAELEKDVEEGIAKPMVDIAKAQIAYFEQMIDSGVLTTTELKAAWGSLFKLQSDEIDKQVKKWEDLGIVAAEATAMGEGLKKGLEKEREEALGSAGLDMEEWAMASAQLMEGIFSEFFFDVFTMKAKKTLDYLRAIVNVWINEFSRQMAQTLIDLGMNAAKGIGKGKPNGSSGTTYEYGVGTAARGGLVMSPTMLLAGEAGPEVILPLDRLNEVGSAFGRGGPAVVMHVHTNDARSFRESQAQILSRMNVALAMAQKGGI